MGRKLFVVPGGKREMNKVCLDTNRLSYEVPRRFHTAWLEISGGEVWIPPTVAYELSQQAPITRGAEEAGRRTGRVWRPGGATSRDEWWKRELEQGQGSYRELVLDAKAEEIKRKVLQAWVGMGFVTGRTEDPWQEPDAHILAEVLVGGGSIVMTCNLKSIKHDELNDWLNDNRSAFGFSQGTLVVDADEETARQSCTGPGERRLLAASIIAVQGERSLGEEVDEYCGRLGSAQLPRTASLLKGAVQDWSRTGALARLEGEVLAKDWKTRRATKIHPEFTGWGAGDSGNTMDGRWTSRYEYAVQYLQQALEAWKKGGREERGLLRCVPSVAPGATKEHMQGKKVALDLVRRGPGAVLALARQRGGRGDLGEEAREEAEEQFHAVIREARREATPEWRWNESAEGKALIAEMRAKREKEGIPSWVAEQEGLPQVDAQGGIHVTVGGGRRVRLEDSDELARGWAMGGKIPEDELPQYMRCLKRDAHEMQMEARAQARGIER